MERAQLPKLTFFEIVGDKIHLNWEGDDFMGELEAFKSAIHYTQRKWEKDKNWWEIDDNYHTRGAVMRLFRNGTASLKAREAQKKTF